MARIVEIYSRRLQVQERFTKEVAKVIIIDSYFMPFSRLILILLWGCDGGCRTSWGRGRCWGFPHVHGDERSTKDQQQNNNKLHVGRISRQSQNKEWIFESSLSDLSKWSGTCWYGFWLIHRLSIQYAKDAKRCGNGKPDSSLFLTDYYRNKKKLQINIKISFRENERKNLIWAHTMIIIYNLIKMNYLIRATLLHNSL